MGFWPTALNSDGVSIARRRGSSTYVVVSATSNDFLEYRSADHPLYLREQATVICPPFSFGLASTHPRMLRASPPLENAALP